MGTGFVMDSSKTSFADVPTLLTHHVSASDKPALSQLLQGLRQPAQVLSHKEEARDQNQTLGKRGGKKKENRTILHKVNLPSIVLKVIFEANEILPVLSFNQDEKGESEI